MLITTPFVVITIEAALILGRLGSVVRSTLSQSSQDPTLFCTKIAAALTSARRINDPAANLFTEKLPSAAGARIMHKYAQVRYPLWSTRLTDDQLRAAIDYIQDHIRDSLDLGSISRAAGSSRASKFLFRHVHGRRCGKDRNIPHRALHASAMGWGRPHLERRVSHGERIERHPE